VRVTLQAEHLNAVGFVVDYRALSVFKKYIDDTFDHRHINDVLPGNPTAELMAQHFYMWVKHQWAEVHSVSVSETGKTWATYSES